MDNDIHPTVASTSALTEELRRLMGLRARSSIRDGSFPAVTALLSEAELTSPDSRLAAMTALIDQAVATIDDAAHRHAAAALLGSGDGRWRTVAQRGTEAASAFACGWDAYRRKRASGTAQLDDTLDSLAAAMIAVSRSRLAPEETATEPGPGPLAPGSNATSESTSPPIVPIVITDTEHRGADTDRGGPDGLEPSPPSRQARRRSIVLMTLVAAVTVAFGALAIWALTHDDKVSEASDPNTSTTSSRPRSCVQLTHRLGDVGPTADDEIREWAPLFRQASKDLPAGANTCAGVMGRDSGMINQPISDGSAQGIGALVAVEGEPRRTLMLHHSEFWVLRNFYLAYGDKAGVPYERDDRDGSWVVRLTQSVVVGGPHEDARLVWGSILAEWAERGGIDGEMGLPVSGQRDLPGVGMVQDFQGGRVTIDFVDSTQVEWKPIPNPASQLPPNIAGRVLVADDGSSWLIDENEVRHWLPARSDYGCATSLAVDVVRDVPIIAIATLEIGEPSRCR
ncbi:MAG: hypothetical protein IPG97_06805 [Microthrixaceae bacterium]|nr:hypothetical protein [Microthrixaceae bacterium]